MAEAVCGVLEWGGSQGSQRGPQGHDIVFMMRLVLAQCSPRKDCQELAALPEDSLGRREFLEIEYVKDKALPKFQTIAAWVLALPAKFLEEVNGKLVREQGGQKEGMALKQWRGDAAGVESNIHYPTDSSLLRDGLNWLYR